MKKLTIQDFQKRLEKIHPKEKLKAIAWGGDRFDTQVQCLTCGVVYTKKGGYFLDKRKISICKNCFPTQPNQLKKIYVLPEEYEYIEEYKGMNNKVLIRHKKCGFIWGITPNNIKLGKGCPKCNKKISKGEQKIIAWLNNKEIVYETQYQLKINKHTFFVDFYLPDYDLYIEYNGEQHYFPIKHFGGIQKLNYQKKNDQVKRDCLKNKLIEIPFTYFDKIEQILESSTTISKESTLQAEMAMEVERLLREYDMVSTSMETQSSSLENVYDVANHIED